MWTISRAHGGRANGLNPRDPPGLIPCGKQTGQTGADKAAPNDSDVVIGCTHQEFINASMSSGCLGTPVVKTSQPSLVTSTLSSDRKSTRLNSSHVAISYAVFCLIKKMSYNIVRNYTTK